MEPAERCVRAAKQKPKYNGAGATLYPFAAREVLSTMESTQATLTGSHLDHITLPARDAQQEKRFWVGLLGAQVEVDNGPFVEVKVGDVSLGFRERSPLMNVTTEAPHFAFMVDADTLLPLKEKLGANGVPTQALWTRSGRVAHMYFKDPSGNLFEFVAPGFPGANDLPRLPSDGGDLEIDVTALDYVWAG
jgi:catechol 2,3-dioxygenase-like lactoylglutathione lyase family enzyme